MKPKSNSLEGIFAKPKTAPAVEVEKPAVTVSKALYVTPSRVGTRGQLVHVNKAAKKMRQLATDLDTSQEALMKEAMNLLFAKYNKEQIA